MFSWDEHEKKSLITAGLGCILQIQMNVCMYESFQSYSLIQYFPQKVSLKYSDCFLVNLKTVFKGKVYELQHVTSNNVAFWQV